MESILQDSGLENISIILDTKLYYSKDVLKSLLLKSCNFPSINDLQKRQEIISKLRLSDKDLQPYFDKLVKIEEEYKDYFESSKTDVEKDSFGQLIFTNEYFKSLNHIPYVLFFMAYFKKLVIPVISLTFPIIAYFLPMLLIKYVWHLPIGLDMYNKIMKTFISFEPKKLLQNCVTIFSIGQTIYQIFQNAFHLHTIDTNILNLGIAVQEYRSTIRSIKEILKENSIEFSFTSVCNDLPDDSRRIFVEISEEPYRLKYLAKDMAYLEVLWKISQEKDFTKVLLVSSDTPYFKAEELYDIHLSKDSRVPSSITIKNGAQHFLLSGPNGGGKSSFLRAILQTLLFSHTFGYSIGSNISLSPFDYILSGLSIHDSPGKKSLFEKEVCFARDVLYYNNPKFKGFVLFDEIFHSTNPPDGIRTSKLFLNTLWNYIHVATIVSTHVFEIIESSSDSVKKICVDAEKIGDTLKYKYSIRNGISRLSSVDEIWKKVWDT